MKKTKQPTPTTTICNPATLAATAAVAAVAVAFSAGLWAQDAERGAPAPTATAAPTAPAASGAWEHLALRRVGHQVTGDPDFAAKVNRLGDSGWQLVDVEAVPDAGSGSLLFFFKRPKS